LWLDFLVAIAGHETVLKGGWMRSHPLGFGLAAYVASGLTVYGRLPLWRE